MSLVLDLKKKAELVLTKKAINHVRCQVGVGFDTSGSMEMPHHEFYTKGVVQTTLNRVLGLALNFDVDGQADSWTFDNECYRLPTITQDNVTSYVMESILKPSQRGQMDLWGGTEYAPILGAVMEKYYPAPIHTGGLFGVGSKTVAQPQEQSPVLYLHFTDGDNSDDRQTEMIFQEAQSKNIYFQLVGIGRQSSFRKLKTWAGRYPNVGCVLLPNIADITDEQLYDVLVTDEFADWARKF